jgi:hypothetical protein
MQANVRAKSAPSSVLVPAAAVAGAAAFVSDRDFVLRTVRVWFPNGMHVLYCTSVGAESAVEGDPGKAPCTIRWGRLQLLLLLLSLANVDVMLCT